ncbi:sugar phosphate nucleotidyltransferase [Altericista sp. CCNU0014]|uniref:sugar phosphate nucleotidyltransferase n=1 Tax=Altericista sp. CCNU0014 TaxID=3082949 RepID=UPI00384B4565
MQAVIIAGGKGTRLAPLTHRSPKPMLPLLDRPFLTWMVDRCREAGVTDILMNVQYQAAQIQDYFRDGSDFGVQIRYILETTPLDTAGSMKLAEPYYSGDPLIVFNADILTDLDLKALIRSHLETQADATLTLARVEDPTAFGLVELIDPPDRAGTWSAQAKPIKAFREKPTAEEAAQLGIDTINAGTYILQPELFRDYPADRPLSFERKVFPDLLAQNKRVTGFIWEGYWMDLGTPAKYIQGQLDMLTGQMPCALVKEAIEVKPSAWVANSAQVDDRAQLEGPCFIGAGTFLGPKAHIAAGTIVGAQSLIDCPLAPGCYAPGTLAV